MATRLRGSRIEEATNAAQSIGRILGTVGKKEQLRRERQQLDRIGNAIMSGASTIDAIKAAADEPTEFDKGLSGFGQRLAGRFQPSPGGVSAGIDSTVLQGRLQEIFSGPDKFDPADVPEGLVPSAFSVSQTGKKTRSFARPFVTKDADKAAASEKLTIANQKKIDKAIENLEDPTASQVKRQRAKTVLRNKNINTAVREAPGGRDFAPEIRGKTREVVDRAGFNDKAFSKKAYDEALAEVLDEALLEGFTEESVERDFNRWWDAKVAEETGQSFIKFQARSEFQKGAKADVSDALPEESTEDLTKLTDEELQKIASGE